MLAKRAQKAYTITFPSTVKRAQGEAFEKNDWLRSVVLNEGLERLEGPGSDEQRGGVFSGTRIKKIALPSTLKIIGDKTFQNCQMLKHAVFREGSRLDKIGAQSFQNSVIETIAIPSSVATIGEEAFSGCKTLGKVSFQEGCKLERVGKRCFFECGFAEIEIPRTVRSIGADSLKNCKNL